MLVEVSKEVAGYLGRRRSHKVGYFAAPRADEGYRKRRALFWRDSEVDVLHDFFARSSVSRVLCGGVIERSSRRVYPFALGAPDLTHGLSAQSRTDRRAGETQVCQWEEPQRAAAGTLGLGASLAREWAHLDRGQTWGGSRAP
jgi:hypothetical protein